MDHLVAAYKQLLASVAAKDSRMCEELAALKLQLDQTTQQEEDLRTELAATKEQLFQVTNQRDMAVKETESVGQTLQFYGLTERKQFGGVPVRVWANSGTTTVAAAKSPSSPLGRVAADGRDLRSGHRDMTQAGYRLLVVML